MVRPDTLSASIRRQRPGAAHRWRWLRAGIGALALAVAAPGWAQTAITSITASQHKGRDVVRIQFNHDTYVAPTSFKLEDPPRFIIDLPGIEIGEANRNIRLQEGNVRAIDLAAGPNRTRIVLDLSVPANLYTNQEQNFVELTLEPVVTRDPAAIQVAAAPPPEPEPEPAEAPIPSVVTEVQESRTETAAVPAAPPAAPASAATPDRAPAVAEQVTPVPAAPATDDAWPPASISEPAPSLVTVPPSSAQQPAAVAAAPPPVPAPANRAVRRPASRTAAAQPANVTLDFVNAEIEAVARTMATITGNNVVVDPRVRGTMTLTSTTPVTPQGALSLFANQLRTQGFSLVEADGIYLVLPEAEAKLHGGRVSAGPVRGGGQIQTHIFRLLHENANNLVPILRPLISPNNTINVDPGANALVITDYGDNLARLASIIAALDVSQATRVEIIALHNTVALDLAPLVASLLDFGAGAAAAPAAAQARPAAAGGSAAITAGAGGAKAALIPEPNSNSIIVRASNPARLAEAVALIRQLDQPPSTWDGNEKGNIHVVYLKNADATKLAVTLRAALAALPGNSSSSGGGGGGDSRPVTQGQTLMRAVIGGGGSSLETGPTIDSAGGNQPSTGGQVQADPSTNSLIISAPEPVYRQLRAVIDQLDQRRAQVFVESLIAEVRTDKMAEFGIQWQGVLGRNGDRNVGVIGTNYGTLGNILAVAPGINDLITNEKFPDSLPVQQGLNLGLAHRFGAGYLLSALANFIQTSGTGNVLSTPTLLTLDNEEARIVVGQNVPFVTGSYANTGGIGNIVSPFQTIERKDVGLTLRVRPQISEDGTIKMAIYQETSNVVPSSVNSLQGLITNKRAIESSVLVNDGQIVVLGGLMEDQYTSGDDRVPVLGDIPLLGNLFRNENRNHVKTNLMVFLRPVIVRDAAATENFSLSRYEYLRAAQMANQPRPSSILQINRAPVMPPATPQHADLTQVPLQPKPLIELPASGD